MLHKSWVPALVVGFWCVTTGWLVVTKILPTFRAGAAPDHASLLAADAELTPVGWTVLWNGSPVGWSFTEPRRTHDGGIEVVSRLHCDRLPIDDMLPTWAEALVRQRLPRGQPVELDATGRVVLDSTGRVCSFSSTVTVPGTSEQAVLDGRIDDDGDVSLSFRAGDLRYDTSCRVPGRMLVGDELSPLATLPGLTEGRRWTVPVYSPLRPGTAPLQVLHAEVGAEETLFWGNRLVNARVVAYREDPSSPREPRCRMWVDRTGRVLRHEAAILGAMLEFVRRTDAEAEQLAAKAAAEDLTPAPASGEAP